MTCPFCGFKQDRVIDSRESKEGDVIRRRRQCLGCERRFTTYERSDEIPYMVVKKDGRQGEVRPSKGPQRAAEGVREAAGSDGETGRDGGCRGGETGRQRRAGDIYYRDRRDAHGASSATWTRSPTCVLRRSIGIFRM